MPTLADWRLYTTLVRFDPVYHSRFKLNLRYLRGFPNLQVGLRLHRHFVICPLDDLLG